jgi:hypothetical protein
MAIDRILRKILGWRTAESTHKEMGTQFGPSKPAALNRTHDECDGGDNDRISGSHRSSYEDKESPA